MTHRQTARRAVPLTEPELAIVHVILNTDCNAWSLNPTPDSPGVCRFCYRERNRVASDAQTVTRVLDVIRSESAARRIVFTGGDPLMPYDNHLEVALRHAAELGFAINIHTNGLLLRERYRQIRDWVDLYSLAIDGPDAATADWFRGLGYFATFTDNLAVLERDHRSVAFNTFTSATSIAELDRTATMILDVASRLRVEYWLISQYRPIGRADARKAAIYGFTPQVFRSAVDLVRERMGRIAVFDQPTRSPDDPYPFRVWVLADGTVTVDLGSVAAPRNEVLGNALNNGFAPLVRQALTLRTASFDCGEPQ
jgi:pyruvate-formate lyase-activating enzyme